MIVILIYLIMGLIFVNPAFDNEDIKEYFGALPYTIIVLFILMIILWPAAIIAGIFIRSEDK